MQQALAFERNHKKINEAVHEIRGQVKERVKAELMAEAEERGAAVAEVAIRHYLGATLMVLRDELSFGKKRLEMVMRRVTEQVSCITEGYVTHEEMVDCIKQETGFDLFSFIEQLYAEKRKEMAK